MTATIPTRRATFAILALTAVLAAFAIGRLGGAGTGTAHAAGCANAGRAVGNLSTTQMRTAIACLLNKERAKAGKRTVRRVRKLNRAAGYHTRDMQRMGFMTHNSSDGHSSTYRMHTQFRYGRGSRNWKVGEILAECWGHGCTPNRILHLWLGSSVHRKVIHSGRWIHFGIGARHGTAENPGRNSGGLFTVDWGYRSG